jgi:hypothetical protein
MLTTIIPIEPSTQAAVKTPRLLSRSESTRSTSSSSSLNTDPEGATAAVEMITDAKRSNQATKIVQMRNIVLEMLHDILCDKANGPEYVNKFSVTITNKWPLLFFTANINPFTVVLASRILARLCISQGPAYVNKFRTISEGFLVMRNLLPHYWNLSQLHETLMVMMTGIDISDYPIYSTFDINNLRTILHDSKEGSKMAVPEVLPIIIAMWDEGRKAVEGPKATGVSAATPFPPILKSPLRARSSSVSIRPSVSSFNNSKQISKEITPASRLIISRAMDAFIQLFDELYHSRPVFREACNKQDVVDCIIQILFPSVCHTANMTTEDELNSKDVSLSNFDLDHTASPSSAMSSPVDGSSPYFDRFGGVDNDTASIDSINTSSGSIIKRGGTSSLMTKTSPHVSKRGQFMTRLR